MGAQTYSLGKPVKLLVEVVQSGVTIPINTIGNIVTLPGRNDSAVASQPDIENATLKVLFLYPSTIEVGFPIDQLATFISDVPLNTPATPA